MHISVDQLVEDVRFRVRVHDHSATIIDLTTRDSESMRLIVNGLIKCKYTLHAEERQKVIAFVQAGKEHAAAAIETSRDEYWANDREGG